MSFLSLLDDSIPQLQNRSTVTGTITAVRGALLFGHLPSARLGDICQIKRQGAPLPAQVVSFENDLLCFAPLEPVEGVSSGATVERIPDQANLRVPDLAGGLVINALGESISDQPHARELEIPTNPTRQQVLKRPPIREHFQTGIKALDLFTPIGKGQRIGLFASAGMGKSTLLGMLARHCTADIIVLALIGERGREVREFIEESLGEDGFRRTILVVSTSDEPALRKITAAKTASAIAEYYRERGKNVLLLFDSLTRFARAVRDVGLAIGEMPVRQGLTPSVYSELPLLVERAGTSQSGSITAIYTVLTEEENQSDSLAGEVRSLLDGHIELSRELFEGGYRPGIDIGKSLSRLADRFYPAEAKTAIDQVRQMFDRLKRDRDIAMLGGTPDDQLSLFLAKEPLLKQLLNQAPEQSSKFNESLKALGMLHRELVKSKC